MIFAALTGGFFFSAYAETAPDVSNKNGAASVQRAGNGPASTLAVGATLDAKGRLWLVRVENQRLLLSRSGDDGRRFSAPLTITPQPEAIMADGESRPKIAVSADGTVHLTWVRALSKRHSGEIRYARSRDGGAVFSEPVTLNDDGLEISHRFDSLASDGRGKVAVAWLDARERDAAKAQGRPFGGVSLYAVESEDNGVHFAPNRRLVEHTCECCRTGMVWSADGPVAFWRNIFDTNTRDFALVNLSGGPVRRATDDDWQIDACPHHGGGIAADGHGALHLVWFTQGNKRKGIFYRRMKGDEMTPPLPIGNPAAQAGHPAVAAAGAMVLLAWREFDGRVYSVWAQRSRDGGAQWEVPRRLAETAGAADYPVPLTDGKKALVVWSAATEGVRVLPVEGAGSKP
ncbi:MAG: exo-alpha-sialidase [Hydrogenophilales bacterium]|nr:exo-alpha-sialidase [Hydrogenophilales bacterium]